MTNEDKTILEKLMLLPEQNKTAYELYLLGVVDGLKTGTLTRKTNITTNGMDFIKRQIAVFAK